MYEQHFGLNKRPFRASATGDDVFVGPNIAATMAGIKKALSANDAIIAVSGAVGSGKTTLATHALEPLSDGRIVVRVGRMRLDSEDVLELLLDELGIEDKPRGTIQRFAVLRRKLKELEDNETRVFVIIEDSVRLGADALAEIEALTSADAGESEGANVILLGDDNLKTLLEEPQLIRVQQRVRQRFEVAALCATELHSYLRHCFRLVGGNFDGIFEANAAQLLHYLSGGIPRINNNLVESAMTATADQNLDQVTSVLLSQIAKNSYGLSTDDFELMPAVEQPTQQEPASAPNPEPVSKPELKTVAELVAAMPQEAEGSPLPEPPVAAEPENSSDEDDIPELIQDTLPDLKILAPEFAAATVPTEADVADAPEPEAVLEAIAEPVAKLVPEPVAKLVPEPVAELVPDPVAEPVAESVPVAAAELQLEIESSGDEVPAWDRDPTVAELKPDLGALEQAMALAQSADPEPLAEDGEPLPRPEPEAPEVIPEITLDNAINERIESKQASKTGEASPPVSEEAPAAEAPQEQDKVADAEMQKIAAELSKAKSIEDIGDKLAETLFGDELNSIAAEFAVIPSPPEPANEDSNAVADEPVAVPVAEPLAESVPEPLGEPVNVPVNKPAIEIPAAAPHATQPDNAPATHAPSTGENSGAPITATQRIRTVRALNSAPQPATPQPTAPQPVAAPRNHLPQTDPSNAPDSFEDQISTSIPDTQTQRVLNVVPPEDEGEDEAKGGFFSRFKRS